MKRAPRSRQRHDLYAKYHDYDSEISDLLGECGVKAVHVFADGNPLPGVVTYRFTPACGKAAASTRMRLAQTQNIVCVAEMSNGALYTAKANVKVTIGGCGG